MPSRRKPNCETDRPRRSRGDRLLVLALDCSPGILQTIVSADVIVVMAFRGRFGKWQFANSTRRGLFVCALFGFFEGFHGTINFFRLGKNVLKYVRKIFRRRSVSNM